MTNRENNTTPVQIKWTRTINRGTTTYHAELAAGGANWSLTIDSPRPGFWALRGWRNGEYAMYDDGRTMRALKITAQKRIENTLKGL